MTTHRFARLILAAAFLAALPAAQALAACIDCGTVVDLRTVTQKGESTGTGAVLGGIAGGVLGHQVGNGRGNTAATVVGAAGGAYVGNEVEKNRNTTTRYVVYVKMEDGSTRNFTYKNPTSYRVGDKVKIVDRKLVRRD
ncbi:MAG TPA: glycine zipper 2TM domain-containing protein [Usitatibacter sp.]|nr:glycine zipper 2TM domain-containing protein [Usitatibacter sp.]